MTYLWLVCGGKRGSGHTLAPRTIAYKRNMSVTPTQIALPKVSIIAKPEINGMGKHNPAQSRVAIFIYNLCSPYFILAS